MRGGRLNVRFVHLCEYATISQEGRLSILGIFDHLDAESLPVVPGMIYLAFEIEVDMIDLGRPFAMQIRLLDPDGALANREGKVEGPSQSARSSIRIPQNVGFAGIPFSRIGRYRFAVSLNAKHETEVPLEVLSPRPASTFRMVSRWVLRRLTGNSRHD